MSIFFRTFAQQIDCLTKIFYTMKTKFTSFFTYFFSLLVVLTLSIGNVWGDVTYDLTGYSTQIANGWTHDYGDIYVGRKGSNYTPSDGGLPTGNGSIFAAFQVTESSSIRVVFVWTKTNGDLSGKQIDLASINKATYDKLALASTGTGNDVKYSIDNFSSSQHSAVAINRSDANKDINIDFETTVSTGYYAVYTASSINASALIKKIIVTPASSCSAPTSPAISGTTSYTEGDNISLTASATGASSATFTWYKGADWATASAGSSIGSSATFTKNSCVEGDAGTYWCNISNGTGCEVQVSKTITVAAAPSCAATVPGNISKGTASGGTGTITLTAAGSPVSGDTWYWQSAADGVDKTGTSGATKSVSAAGTYYIRSYNTSGDCWSDAKNVTVDAADLLTAISPTLTYDANVLVGNPLSPTLTGNAGSGSVSYALNDVSPAGSLTINSETGVVTAVTAGGTATVTATIAANGNYAAGAATSGTITVLANPLGTHTITYTLSPINTADASLTSTQVSTSAYLKNLTTIDASLCGFASSPSKAGSRTAKINRASTTKDDDKYVYLSFDVESGYQFTPSSIVVKVANVSNATTFDASLISSNGPSVGEEEKSFSSTDGSVETWTITNEAETALTGTVTLKIWPYAASAGSFRFGTPITITGAVAEYVAPCPATMPGNISKGTLSSGTLTLNAAGTPEIGDTWYWQTSESGTSTSNSGTSYGVTSAGTYYVRSYNTTGECWSAAKSITVTAADFVETYTVVYKDGTTELGSETIEVGSHPTASGISTTKLLCTFASWQLSGSDVALNEVDGAADETVTLTARWTKTYAQTADLATEAAGDKTAIATFLANKGYSAKVGSGGAYDTNASGYLGYKFKNNKDTVQFYLQNGKIVDIAFMYIEANFKVYVDGVETYTVTNKTTSKTPLLKYVYANGADKFIVIQNNSADTKSAVINKIDIHNPFVVTYDATTNGGEAVDAATFTGAALTLPSATKSTENFLGWYTTASEGGSKIGDAGDSYTPTASITLYARFEAISTDARLASISFSSNAGTLSPTFDPEVVNYTYTMPYKTADIPTITGATSVHANAHDPEIVSQASAWGETAVIRGVAESGDKKTYNVTMQVAPKDMLCLVWADVDGDNKLTYNATKSKYYAAADVTLANSNVRGKDGSAPSGKKFQSNGYLKIALNEGTFNEGDIVALDVTYGTANVMHVFKAQTALEADVIGTASGNTDAGLNKVAITEDAATLWLVRGGNYGSWNPHVDYVAVYRAYPKPLVGSMAINSIDVTVNNAASTKTITGVMPSGTNFASLSISNIAYLSNNPSETDGVLFGSWNELTSQYEGTFTVTDKDFDVTVYTVTLTEDVAVESVSVSGETTVAAKSQIALTATVLPEGVSNKDVIWSSSDETKATVDANGVVTGKAAGSVTITATSVADGTKKGTLDITVTKFVGTEYAYWFAYAADAEANGVENNSAVFGSAPTGTTDGAKEITLEEGWVVNTTKKAGSSTLGSFTVPADFTATLYVVVKGSGSSGRYIQLKQSDVVKYTSEEFGSADPTVLKIDGVAAGTYTIANEGGLSNFYLYAAELNSYPLTSVALEEGFNLRLEQSRTPIFTITPAKAAVASQVWSVVSRTGASDANLNTSTGEITAGAEEGTLTVKVTVTDAFGNEVESGNCVVKIVNIIDQKDVTGSMTWNWTGAGTSNVTIDNEEALVLGNYIDGDEWAYLKGTNGDQAYHHESSYGSYQGKGTLSFKTTVPGLVTITARRISNNADLKIGEDAVLSLESSNKTSKAYFVPAGEVNIIADATKGMRILKIEFDAEPTVDKIEGSHFGGYTRTVNPQYYGTICLPKAGVMTGALLFQIAYMDYKEDGVTPYKVYYDQVENGIMQAGMPYIFLAEQSTIGVYYTGTTAVAQEDLLTYHGLHGTLVDMVDMSGTGIYMLYNNKVLHSTNPASYLNANRAYIQISEIPGYNNPGYMAPAPKIRRISTSFSGTNVATGLDQISQEPRANNQKLLINGQLFILRGEKKYDATGRLVK